MLLNVLYAIRKQETRIIKLLWVFICVFNWVHPVV